MASSFDHSGLIKTKRGSKTYEIMQDSLMCNVSFLFLSQEKQSVEHMCFSEIFLVDTSKKKISEFNWGSEIKNTGPVFQCITNCN